MNGSRPVRGLSAVESVLVVLVVAAFAVAVGRVVLRRMGSRAPGATEGGSFALESAAERALVAPPGHLPAASPAEGVDEPPVALRLEPGPRAGLERVRVSAGTGTDASRGRLSLVRLGP